MANDIDYTLPGDPAVDRMWIVRLAEWISQRRFALALLCIGMLFLLAGLIPTIDSFRRSPGLVSSLTMEAAYMPSANSSSSGMSDFGLAASKESLSILLLVGAALSSLAILWAGRQFSLRWLLLCVLLTGALSSAPFQAPTRISGTASFKVMIKRPITAAELDSIRQKLEPSAALATLPAGYRELLNPGAQAGVVDFHCEAWNGKSNISTVPPPKGGITCSFSIRDNVSREERKALTDFYDFYARYVVLSLPNLSEDTLKPAQLSVRGPFGPYHKEWLEKIQKLSKE
jgi:hypothetical protein